MWTCPNCRLPLVRAGNALLCEARHCFDIAREGYVNLLPAHRKRSRDPGDNREMISARCRVHRADIYRPLGLALVDRIGGAGAVLDLGCGEGYYSSLLLKSHPQTTLWGIDIAKPAVRLAAKTCRAGRFAVASSYQVPLPETCLDAAFCVFAPASEAELQRLLRPGGRFLKVSPGPRHLWELRQLLYDEPRLHSAQAPSEGPLGLAETESLEFEVDIPGDLLADLVAMTPYAYGGQREKKQKLAELDGLSLSMHFLLSLQEKTG